MPSTSPLQCFAPHVRLAHDFLTLPGWRLPRRRINDHALLFVAAGLGEADLDGRRLELRPGILLLVPPDLAHDLGAANGCRLHLLNIHFDPLPRSDAGGVAYLQDPLRPRRRLLAETLLLPPQARAGLAHPVSSSAVYQGLFRRVLKQFMAAGPAGILRQRAAMLDLLAWLYDDLRPLAAGHADAEITDRARAILAAASGSGLSLQAVADRLGIGRTRLAEAFRRSSGETPAAWQRRQRIETAKALLAYDGVGVREAATRTGFISVAHFTRVFTSLVGLPPGAWRAGAGADEQASRRPFRQ
jgi:AraC-like DNA-binding protein